MSSHFPDYMDPTVERGREEHNHLGYGQSNPTVHRDPSQRSYTQGSENLSYPHSQQTESGVLMPEPYSPGQGGFSEAQNVAQQYTGNPSSSQHPFPPIAQRRDSSIYPDDSASNFSNSTTSNLGYYQDPTQELGSRGPAGIAKQKSNLGFVREESGEYGSSPSGTVPPEMEFLNSGPAAASSSYYPYQAGKKPSISGLSYVDEDGGYHRVEKWRPVSTVLDGKEREDASLLGGQGGYNDLGYEEQQTGVHFSDSTKGGLSSYPPTTSDKPSQSEEIREPFRTLSRWLDGEGGKYENEQRKDRKKRGIGRQRYPIVSWILTVVMSSVMIFELVRNNALTGKPIATSPVFNVMIGPTSEVLINIGARFAPCMKEVPDLPPSFQLACLNDTANPPTTACNLGDICGFGGVASDAVPNQWYRFILPIGIHVGVVHLLINLAGQLLVAAQVEREMGSIPFTLVYFASGIYGNIFSGNFALVGIPSVGASGALYGISGCMFVDLMLHWKYISRPKLQLLFLAIELAIGIAIGYIPNAVDGLAHLLGWCAGLLTATILYPAIIENNKRAYIIWGARVVALVLIIIAYVLTTKNFYTDDSNAACTWCKYLGCWPTAANNQCKGTGITTYNTSSNTRRSWELL